MGARAVGVFLFILCLSASASMMNGSGMSEVLGVSPDTGIDDDINDTVADQSEFESNRPDVADYLGYAVAAVGYFLDIFVVLGPVESALRNIGFPDWFVFPLMNLVTRPIYYIAAVQMIRGVMVE